MNIDFDTDLLIDRVFQLSGVSRDEVVLEIMELPPGLCGFWMEPNHTETYRGIELRSEDPFRSKIIVAAEAVESRDYRSLLRTLAHEIQHYKQWRDGRLAGYVVLDLMRTPGMSWEGKAVEWDYESCLRGAKLHPDYWKDPWEVEAREAEWRIFAMYRQTYGVDLIVNKGAA